MHITFTGKVILGKQEGRAIGFPTANLDIPSHEITLAHGIYAGMIDISEKNITNHPAAIIVRPTEEATRIEIHLLDFHQDIYGANVTVHVEKLLRDWKNFETSDELVEQIKKDIILVREINQVGL